MNVPRAASSRQSGEGSTADRLADTARLPPRNRRGTVYDATAGRIGANGFLRPTGRIPRTCDTASLPTVPLPPDEHLFKRKRAPIRYEEIEIYFADQKLGPHQNLPDADLLRALHAYAADYFASPGPQKTQRAWKSMDETALLALGILLEETTSSTLGVTGELVFTEEDQTCGDRAAQTWDGAQWVESVIARRPASESTQRPDPNIRESSPQDAIGRDRELA